MLKAVLAPRTFWLEVTGWRGVWIDRTLFGPVLRIGWLGFGLSRWNLTEFIKAWHETLRAAKKGKQK